MIPNLRLAGACVLLLTGLLASPSDASAAKTDWPAFWRDGDLMQSTPDERATLDHAFELFQNGTPDPFIYDVAAQVLQEHLERLAAFSTLSANQRLEAGRAWMFLGELLGGARKIRPMFQAEERALAIIAPVLAPGSVEYAQLLESHSYSYNAIGDTKAGIPLREKALKIRLAALEKQPPDIDEQLVELATAYYGLGQFEKALPLLQRVLSMREQSFGPSDLSTADILDRMANVYSALNRHLEALPLELRSLEIRDSAINQDPVRLTATLNMLGETYRFLGSYEDSIKLNLRALSIRETIFEPRNILIAISLNNLALDYSALDRDIEALPLQQRALEIFEANFGDKHPNVLLSLTNLAAILRRLRLYKESQELYKRAVAIRSGTSGLSSEDAANDMLALAEIDMYLGRYNDAVALLEPVIAVRESSQGPNDLSVAVALADLGSAHQRLSQFSAAEQYLNRAVSIAEKKLAADDNRLVIYLTLMGSLYLELDRYDDALVYLNKAMSIVTHLKTVDSGELATLLTNLSLVHTGLDEGEEAISLGSRALGLQKSREASSSDVAVSLLALGTAYHSRGRDHDAEVALSEAVSIFMDNNLSDRPDRIGSYCMLARVYIRLGRYGAAEDLALRSRDEAARLFPNDHVLSAYSMETLAAVYSLTGRTGEALALMQEALVIVEQKFGSDSKPTADALHNLAAMYYETGQHSESLELDLRALDIRLRRFGPNHSDVADSLNNVAANLEDLGDLAEALPISERALHIREAVLGLDHPDLSISLANLASIEAGLGRLDEALIAVTRAETIASRSDRPFEQANAQGALAKIDAQLQLPELAIFWGKRSVNTLQEMRSDLVTGSPFLRQGFVRKFGGAYENLVGWLIDAGRLAEAQQVLSMLKEEELHEFRQRSGDVDAARAHADYLGKETPLAAEQDVLTRRAATVGPQLDALETTLAQRKRADPQATLAPADEETRVRLREELDRINKDQVAFTAKLADQLRTTAISVDDLARLADHANDYRELIDQLNKTSGEHTMLVQYIVTPDKLYILLHSANASTHLTLPVKASVLNQEINALREAIRNPGMDPRPAASALYQHLIAPIDATIKANGTQHLMVSLTGALRYIPIATLYDGQQYLVQRMSLSLFSEAATSRLNNPPLARWAIDGFGLTHEVPGFAALPGVREELLGLNKGAGLKGPIYLDQAFTDVQLRRSMDNPQPVLHIASHFSLAPGDYTHSFLVLGDGRALSLAEIGKYSFRGVDLLTLSACETGLGGGPDANGREVESLGTLVQGQGAKSVLASLWKVSDTSTARLMERFYWYHQHDKLSKGEALRRAQLEFIGQGSRAVATGKIRAITPDDPDETPQRAGIVTSTSHPYYWAPFVLMGNWL